MPISTGGGKALFIGTYLDADGDSVEVREALLDERPALRARLEREGPVDEPEDMVLERVLDRVAAESYPDLETDAALGRLGRQNLGGRHHRGAAALRRDAGLEVLRDLDRRGAGGDARPALADAAARDRRPRPRRARDPRLARRFEALVAGLVLLYMTAIAALLIASPRRELVVLPLLAALAGTAVAVAADSLARWRWAGLDAPPEHATGGRR